MIDITKKYRTRSGQEMRILCVDILDAAYPVLAMDATLGYVYAYTLTGKYNRNLDSPFDLIEINQWDSWKIDDLIKVRDFLTSNWRYRHFAGVRDGKVCCWAMGQTSLTNDGNYSAWTYAELVGSEELEQIKHSKKLISDEYPTS